MPYFHEDAAKRFDERGVDLIAAVTTEPAPEPPRDPARYRAPVSSADVGPVTPDWIERPDPTGEYAALTVTRNGQPVGILRDNHLKLEALAQTIQRSSGVKWVASFEFIKTQTFEWLIDRHEGKTADSLPSRLSTRLDAALTENEFWFPLYNVFFQGAAELGFATFKTIPPSLLANTHKHMVDGAETEAERRAGEHIMNRLTQDIGGRAAAVVKVTAERSHAKEIAHQHALRSVGCLRLFSSAHHDPSAVSQCVLKGEEHLPYRFVFDLKSDRIHLIERGIENPELMQPELIEDEFLTKFKELGWRELHDTLKKPSPSEFEEEALSSILLYGRSVLKAESADRLIYTFAALEGLLLRNTTEPLVQNIADRMAFALEKTREGRLRVIENVKRAYDIRSRFVHHREEPKDRNVLLRFNHEAWMFFVRVITAALPRFRTKEEFLNTIDNVKYS